MAGLCIRCKEVVRWDSKLNEWSPVERCPEPANCPYLDDIRRQVIPDADAAFDKHAHKL